MKGSRHSIRLGAAVMLASVTAACRTPPPPPVPWHGGEAVTSAVLPPPVIEYRAKPFVANLRIRSPEGSSDGFAQSMAMGNRTLAVGAPGSAGGGAVWVFDAMDLSRPPARLGPGTDPSVGGFGASVAVSASGKLVAVGAPGTMVNGMQEAGVVFLWRRERDEEVWSFVGKFHDEQPVEGAHLGFAVAVNEQNLLAGAPDADVGKTEDHGVVVAWTSNRVGKFRNPTRLMLENVTGGGRLGSSITLMGSDAVVGAAGDRSAAGVRSGTASLFRNQLGKWKDVPLAVMTGERSGPVDRFGTSVGLYLDDRSGQPMRFRTETLEPALMVVGAPGANLPGRRDTGAVHIFRQDPRTRRWIEATRLVAPQPQMDSAFGHSVNISRDRLVVGSPGLSVGTTPDAGVAHVFEQRVDRDSEMLAWKATSELRTGEAVLGGRFGDSVSATDDFFAVSEPGTGMVHLFRRTPEGAGLPLPDAAGQSGPPEAPKQASSTSSALQQRAEPKPL